MKINQDKINLIKRGTHLIKMPDYQTDEDVELLGIITHTDRSYAVWKFYDINRKGCDVTSLPAVHLHDLIIKDDGVKMSEKDTNYKLMDFLSFCKRGKEAGLTIETTLYAAVKQFLKSKTD